MDVVQPSSCQVIAAAVDHHGWEDAVCVVARVEEQTSLQPLVGIGKHRPGVVTTAFVRVEAQASVVMRLMTQLVGQRRRRSWIRRAGSRCASSPA
jgi:hypothetical protein